MLHRLLKRKGKTIIIVYIYMISDEYTPRERERLLYFIVPWRDLNIQQDPAYQGRKERHLFMPSLKGAHHQVLMGQAPRIISYSNDIFLLCVSQQGRSGSIEENYQEVLHLFWQLIGTYTSPLGLYHNNMRSGWEFYTHYHHRKSIIKDISLISPI